MKLSHLTLPALLSLAALVAVAPDARADAVAPGAATALQREQAQAKFVRGRDLFQRKDYAGALAEFRASLDIVASPNTRLYAGRSLRELGRLVEAYVELGRASVEGHEYARDDPRYAQAGEAAAHERSELAARLGFVELTVERPGDATTLRVSGEDVRRAGWTEPLPVLPGTTEIVVASPGREPIRKTVQLAAGQRTRLTIDADGRSPAPLASTSPTTSPSTGEPARGGPSPLRLGAYAAGGVGAIGLATFGVFGVLSNKTYSDLESACGAGPCPPGHDDEIARGKTQQTIANVGLVVGAVGLATGVTLFVLSTGKGSADARVGVATAPGGAALWGTF